MKDAVLYSAGFLGILVSLIHGWLGETRVIHGLNARAQVTERINRAVFHLSTVYWLAGGIALVFAPLLDEQARAAVAWSVAAMYCAGAIANFWATRGRHFGAYLLLIVAALAFSGAR